MDRNKLDIDAARRQAGELAQAARDISDKAREDNGRRLTQEEQREFDNNMAQVKIINEDIQRELMLRSAEEQYQGLPEPMRTSVLPPGDGKVKGLETKDIRGFSFQRAILAAHTNDWSKAGLEKEISEEAAKAAGRSLGPNSFMLPTGAERRDLTMGTEATDIRAVDFGDPIELLRNKMVTRAAGITVLTNLRGDFQFPKHTATNTNTQWVTEGNAPTEGVSTFGQVKISPKQLATYTDLTRQTLLQTSFDVEAFIRAELIENLSVELDRVVLHGSGTNEPTGVINVSGIGDVAGGTNGAIPTWANIVQIETEVAQDNADLGALAYITNPKVRGKLKSVEKATNTGVFVWQDPYGFNSVPIQQVMNGYPAFVTNQVSSTLTKGSRSDASAIFFGNWREVLLGIWSGIEVIVDPYTGSNAGTVRLVALANADVGVRHAESFAAMKDALVV